MEGNDFIGILITWAPVLLITAAWIVFMVHYTRKGTAAKYVGYMRENVEEMRRVNQQLERIAAALERR